jgi:hypothetical protein
VAEVRSVLGRCQLAVHLIGSRRGFVPDGPDEKSAVQLQNEQGVERAKAGGLSRLIWLPIGTHSAFPDHQAFIDSLLQDQEAQFGADLITGSREAIKEAIRTALQKLEVQHHQAPTETATSRLVYLVCDERDRKATIPLRKFLHCCGLECKIPVFEGDPAEVRKANQELLADCEAVLVFYGAGDEAWKRSVDAELRKAPSYRAGKPWTASYTYLSEPATEDKKELIHLEESNLIDGLSGFSTAAFEPFTRALQARPSPSAEA